MMSAFTPLLSSLRVEVREEADANISPVRAGGLDEGLKRAGLEPETVAAGAFLDLDLLCAGPSSFLRACGDRRAEQALAADRTSAFRASRVRFALPALQCGQQVAVERAGAPADERELAGVEPHSAAFDAVVNLHQLELEDEHLLGADRTHHAAGPPAEVPLWLTARDIIHGDPDWCKARAT